MRTAKSSNITSEAVMTADRKLAIIDGTLYECKNNLTPLTLTEYGEKMAKRKYTKRILKTESKTKFGKGHRLTGEDKQKIVDLREAGKTSEQVAEELGMSLACVNKYWDWSI